MRIKTAIRVMPALLLTMSAMNGIIAVRVWLSSGVQPQVNLTMVEAPRVTNSVELISAPSPRDGLVGSSAPVAPAVEYTPPESIPQRYSSRYCYFRANGRSYALMYGERYTVGMATAYGRIVRIYPERIYLEGGDYIENTNLSNERMQINDNTGSPANG